MLPIIPIVLGIAGIASRVIGSGKTLVSKVAAPVQAVKAAAGAVRPPQTKLGRALTRALYGVCIVMLVWEVLGRQVLIPIICPELLLQLPPSMLDTVLELLLSLSVE